MSLSVAVFNPRLASVIKKQIMALTGLAMCGFLLIHLAGNLLLFKGPEIFNQYAFFMLNHPIIMVLEWLLAGIFLIHAGCGLVLVVENKRARPVSYASRLVTGRGAKMSFLSMSLTGPLLLIFVAVHLVNFKYGSEYIVVQGGVPVRDLYRTVAEYFSNIFNVALYILAMCTVALHVQHGFWSAFQTFGAYHPRFTKLIEAAADVYAIVILVGFIVIPLSFVSWSA